MGKVHQRKRLGLSPGTLVEVSNNIWEPCSGSLSAEHYAIASGGITDHGPWTTMLWVQPRILVGHGLMSVAGAGVFQELVARCGRSRSRSADAMRPSRWLAGFHIINPGHTGLIPWCPKHSETIPSG